jgi:nucleoid-associated protein YgaU
VAGRSLHPTISLAIRINMTFQAPLTASGLNLTSSLARLGLAATVLVLSACANQPGSPQSAVLPNPAGDNAAISAANLTGTAAITTGTNRKRALRALAEGSVRTDNPGNYTVVRGDTLWDISERFLSRPWLWPEIWHVNPQIANPHLIYPGDQIALTYVDGKPRLELIRASSTNSAPISPFPLDSIKEFLIEPKVVSNDELMAAPYIVAAEEGRLISSTGSHVFVRGDTSEQRYSVFRPGDALVDPDTGEVLGHEAVHVSKASLVKSGDPSKMILTSNKRETLVGDRLMSNPDMQHMSFQPRTATVTKPGKIISLFDAVSRAGKNQVVVLNLGENDGVQAGDVMSVISDDRRIRDVVSRKKNDFVTIPGDQSGVIMVFRTFERVSYALIMSSARSINLYDRIDTMVQ